MRTRVALPALALSAVVAALALSFAPRLASAFTDHPDADAGTSEHLVRGTRVDAAPVVARIEPSDPTVDRALKDRLVLVATIASVLSVSILAQRWSRGANGGERASTAAPSPFCGRAPPLVALSA
jgi:hypothetical protein